MSCTMGINRQDRWLPMMGTVRAVATVETHTTIEPHYFQKELPEFQVDDWDPGLWII